jgi:Cd2+/Zn2+-exporting ATPase
VADSTLAKIANMVAEAQKQKSAREHFVQRFAKIYTPLVIVAAVLIAAIPPVLTALTPFELGDFDTWLYRACELLVISCPCAFVISTPVTMVSALARAAKLGVLVKGGAFFEEGAQTRAVAFDKTGTLTKGRPRVEAVELYVQGNPPHQGFEITSRKPGRGGTVGDEVGPTARLSGQPDGGASSFGGNAGLVAVAAALESHSTHPLGVAVIEYANREGLVIPVAVSEVRELAGKGIRGAVEGVPYAIGSAAFIRQEGVSEGLDGLLEKADRQGGTALVLARTGDHPQLLGAILVADELRDEAPAVMAALHRLRGGLRTVMLTGDNEKVATVVAKRVGIDEVYASLLPQDKTAEMKELRQRGASVAFVGDGINDAPTLAAADLGIAMGGAGSAAALSSADVVLMADDLSALPRFFRLSTKTVRTLRQNVTFAIGFKALVAALVVIGVAPMWLAVLADTGVSLLVILNGMRLLRTRL